VLIHVHPRLVLHGDELKVRAVTRALAVLVHEAFCGLGGHDYLRRIAERRAITPGRTSPGVPSGAGRRIRGDRGQRLLRKRGELLERPCAHLYETGGLRRTHVRGHENVLKRLLVHAGAFNLGLWMRTLFGVGTPRSLQGRLTTLGAVLNTLWTFTSDAMTTLWTSPSDSTGSSARDARIGWHGVARVRNATCTTGS
jgi:hypothetical protein